MMYRILKISIHNNVCRGFRSMAQLCAAGSSVMRSENRSDFFPFIGNRYYTAKPLCVTEALARLDYQDRKHLRFTRYVDTGLLDEFLTGGYFFSDEIAAMSGKTMIDGGEVIFRLTDNSETASGIYCIIESDPMGDADIERARELFGPGTAVTVEALPRAIADRMSDTGYKLYELLSPLDTTGLTETELAALMECASYDIQIIGDGGVCFKTGSCITSDAAAELGIGMKLGVIKHGEQ